MRRFLKQFLYGLFYLSIVALLAGGVYYFYFTQEPSCFDNIKNQGEAGVDCGGPCIDCELLTIALQIDEPQVFSLGKLKSTILGRVSNHSLNYGLNSFEYEFQIFNSLGALLSKFQGKSYILPGEERYLIVPALDIDKRDIGKVVLNIPREDWEPKSNLPDFALKLQDIKIAPLARTVQVSGNLANDSSENFPSVTLVGIVFDKKDTALSVSSTRVDDIAAFSEKPFTIFFPELKNVAEVNLGATKVFYEVKR